MRIISKFKDYYDSVLTYGIDPKLIFIRKEKTIEVSGYYLNRNQRQTKKIEEEKTHIDVFHKIHKKIPENPKLNFAIIGFCGRIYPCIMFNYKGYYNFSQLERDVKKEIKLKPILIQDLKNILKPTEIKKYFYPYGHHNFNYNTWNHFLNNSDIEFTVPEKTHRFFKSPIIVYYNNYIIVNARLNIYNFQTVVGPWEAYQELSMYVGNNLVDQMNPEVNISDKIKAESKGFNKWSFRRHKDESKKNKR